MKGLVDPGRLIIRVTLVPVSAQAARGPARGIAPPPAGPGYQDHEPTIIGTPEMPARYPSRRGPRTDSNSLRLIPNPLPPGRRGPSHRSGPSP